MKIAVLGAGAWGTALAAAAAARHDVLLWARDAGQAALIASSRRNARYLGDFELPPALRIASDHAAALAHAEGGLLVMATPMAALRERLAALPDSRPVLWLCKGFEAGGGLLGHEVAAEVRPGADGGVLSGPSFAIEVARGQPTALVAASNSPALNAAAVAAFHSEALRIYTSDDRIGVERDAAARRVECQPRALQRNERVAERELDTTRPEAPQPGAQQRAGLEAFGKHTAARADEGLLTEIRAPLAQRIRRKSLEERRQRRCRFFIAREEAIGRLAMGDVQPAPARHQEFARERGHAVEHVRVDAARGECLGCHQARRSATDDRDPSRPRVTRIVIFGSE